jgi:hypothetical protein
MSKTNETEATERNHKYIQALPLVTRILLVILLLLPLLGTVVELINVLTIYNQARSGINHMTTIKQLFVSQQHAKGLLDSNKLKLAQREIGAAHRDFQYLSERLEADASMNLLSFFAPKQITSIRSLSHLGIEGTDIGQELISSALILSPGLREPLLATSKRPLVTQKTLDVLRQTINAILPRLDHINAEMRNVTLDGLPISDQQRELLTTVIQFLPQVRPSLIELRGLLNPIGWLVGIHQPRTLLLQTMDRAELRPSGGFTGQYGELSISGGRIAPFTLKDIGPIEENNPYSRSNGASPPAPYNTWWPIANWGLRDANLSADFPTSARLAIQTYASEFNKQVDGVVLFSPFLISRILQVTGPLSIPQYHETITAQNLEEKLHYYQLDNKGIYKEVLVEHVKQTPQDPQIAGTQARKLFTRRLASVLMNQIRHAPPDEMLALVREMLYDLKTKDLQIYVTNPQIEALIGQYGSTSEIDRSTQHDGLFVVQANVSASKASQYVRTNIQDRITLDTHGGATHVMTLKLDYTQAGPVYGFDTYRDYVRIYVPSKSQFLWGNGFDQGFNQPLCGGRYPACPQDDIYGNGALACQPDLSQSGFATWLLGDPYYEQPHPMDRIGPPTTMQSDQAGRTMFGGFVTIPKNCDMTVTLSWYVPAQGHTSTYSLFFQRQASTQPTLDLTIRPTIQDCLAKKLAGLYFHGVLGTEDRLFTLNPTPGITANQCLTP